ncbi:MAG: beta-propeller fold lactonase family protein, partial [Verrucomicrobiota bacterium]
MKSEIPVLLGTYTEPLPHVEGRGPGILPCCLDLETGAIRPTGPAIPVRNPAYMWRNGSLLYATSEISDFEGNEDGSLTVLRINERTIESIQTTSSEGSGPAWICGEATGRWLLVANYLEGNCKVFSLGENGSIRESVTSLRFSGSGTDPIRQDASHPHAILSSPDNRHIYLADLGTDELVIF